MIPRESDFTKNQANSTSGDTSKLSSKASSSSTASWSRWKDPRIVRVSRAFGGKDRHSKVCTVRGLRDRRVRLSVSTAIQLYDLQDRLGLSQPSKVVDWLLDAAKEGIDELPPLQIPQGGFSQHLQQALASHEFQSDKQGLKINGSSFNWNYPFKHSSSNITVGKSKDNASGESSNKGEANWARNTEEERQLNRLESQGLYNPIVRWDPSNLTLFHPPRSLGSIAQPDQDLHGFNLMQLPPTQMSMVPSGSHQVLVYQPGITAQPYFPSHLASTSTEFDPKQMNFQGSELSNSSLTPSVYHLTTQPAVRPFPFSITPNLLPSLKHAASEQIYRNDFPL